MTDGGTANQDGNPRGETDEDGEDRHLLVTACGEVVDSDGNPVDVDPEEVRTAHGDGDSPEETPVGQDRSGAGGVGEDRTHGESFGTDETDTDDTDDTDDTEGQ